MHALAELTEGERLLVQERSPGSGERIQIQFGEFLAERALQAALLHRLQERAQRHAVVCRDEVDR
ncbi:hypothetical protein LOZ80_30060 [Paenibacillus sp. HWE-109]|nr:hypothetical protein [Paenibacillus sp. HWE-109]UKS25766.1 hypothetical protein LOZ80_30060 [Paenibacillus sp. HWE-109]